MAEKAGETDYLMLTLYAPMAAMGDVAVGEARASSDIPSKSAVLGLVAAALGIDRSAYETHQALDESYGFGVLVCQDGRPMDDYHTAQTVSGAEVRKWSKAAGRAPGTRKELLEAGSLETVLSTRGYRTDSLYTVALWVKADAPYTLEAIKAAIEEPHYVLYFGRKACPFAAPLLPTIVEGAVSAGAAFRRYVDDGGLSKFANLFGLEIGEGGDLTYRTEEHSVPMDDLLYRTQRRDRITDRRVWQFLPREEAVARLPRGEWDE